MKWSVVIHQLFSDEEAPPIKLPPIRAVSPGDRQQNELQNLSSSATELSKFLRICVIERAGWDCSRRRSDVAAERSGQVWDDAWVQFLLVRFSPYSRISEWQSLTSCEKSLWSRREFEKKSFRLNRSLVSAPGVMAESENTHPALQISCQKSWNRVPRLYVVLAEWECGAPSCVLSVVLDPSPSLCTSIWDAFLNFLRFGEDGERRQVLKKKWGCEK